MTHNLPDPETLLGDLLDKCLQAGASAADAKLARSRGVSVSVLNGKMETIERQEADGVALRCLFGQRQASVSGSDLSAESLSALSARCVAMARAAPEDPYCGLADGSELLTHDRDLDLSGDAELPASQLEAEALEAEAAALSVNGIKMVSGCGASWSGSERWVAATNGFASHKKGSSSGLGLAAVAATDGEMERDYESWSSRKHLDRPAPEEIGRVAAERAVARLGSRKLESRTANVIYDRRVAASLLGAFVSAISGPAIARGVSFLKDRLGEQVFADGINVIDDPHRPLGFGSRAHDGEGRPVEKTHLIEAGRLTQWLLNGPSARQLGIDANGFAGLAFGEPPGIATSNLYIEPGTRDQNQLIKDAKEGLLVTDMFGPSINPNTGDYSVGVAGFWFENGSVAFPVSEVTIAGDLPSMFARMIAGSDLEFRSSRESPSLLVPEMSLAGA